MEGKGADRKIKAGVMKWEQFRIGGNWDGRSLCRQDDSGFDGDDTLDPRSMGERPRQRATMRAEIENCAELAANVVQAIDDPVGDLDMQKINAPATRRTLAVQPPGAAIEQRCRFELSSGHPRPFCGWGLTNANAL
jgi:hypothetical protein